MIATLTEIDDNEYAPLNKVSAQIRSQLLRDKKYDYIVKSLSGSTLAEQAASLGSEVEDFSDVTFGSFYVNGVGMEPRLVGAIASAEKGALSAPVKGLSGVYVFEVGDVKTDDKQTAEGEKVRAQAMAEGMAQQFAIPAIQQMAKIQDLLPQGANGTYSGTPIRALLRLSTNRQLSPQRLKISGEFSAQSGFFRIFRGVTVLLTAGGPVKPGTIRFRSRSVIHCLRNRINKSFPPENASCCPSAAEASSVTASTIRSSPHSKAALWSSSGASRRIRRSRPCAKPLRWAKSGRWTSCWLSAAGRSSTVRNSSLRAFSTTAMHGTSCSRGRPARPCRWLRSSPCRPRVPR